MSSFCLCVCENITNECEKKIFVQEIKMIAQYYKRGIKFSLDWPEPIISCVQKDSLVVNILDSPESNNCELFLLPDGWYSNGKTDKIAFRERMRFLRDVSNVFIEKNYIVSIYLGQSGTLPEEFSNCVLKINNFIDFLMNTVGFNGVDDGIHINIIP